jgi:hypothetical protein
VPVRQNSRSQCRREPTGALESTPQHRLVVERLAIKLIPHNEIARAVDRDGDLSEDAARPDRPLILIAP